MCQHLHVVLKSFYVFATVKSNNKKFVFLLYFVFFIHFFIDSWPAGPSRLPCYVYQKYKSVELGDQLIWAPSVHGLMSDLLMDRLKLVLGCPPHYRHPFEIIIIARFKSLSSPVSNRFHHYPLRHNPSLSFCPKVGHF